MPQTPTPDTSRRDAARIVLQNQQAAERFALGRTMPAPDAAIAAIEAALVLPVAMVPQPCQQQQGSPNIHPFPQPAPVPPPRPTVESRRAGRMAALRLATGEVARCERTVDCLIGRLAEKSIGRVGLSPITEHTLRNAVSQLSLAQVQVARLREALLERDDDDAETCEGLGEALRGAFDRIVCGTGQDESDEHRLGYVELLGGRF